MGIYKYGRMKHHIWKIVKFLSTVLKSLWNSKKGKRTDSNRQDSFSCVLILIIMETLIDVFLMQNQVFRERVVFLLQTPILTINQTKKNVLISPFVSLCEDSVSDYVRNTANFEIMTNHWIGCSLSNDYNFHLSFFLVLINLKF